MVERASLGESGMNSSPEILQARRVVLMCGLVLKCQIRPGRWACGGWGELDGSDLSLRGQSLTGVLERSEVRKWAACVSTWKSLFRESCCEEDYRNRWKEEDSWPERHICAYICSCLLTGMLQMVSPEHAWFIQFQNWCSPSPWHFIPTITLSGKWVSGIITLKWTPDVIKKQQSYKVTSVM